MSDSPSDNSETDGRRDNQGMRYEECVSHGSKQETCKVCGLTARNEAELEDHIDHAHNKRG